MEKLKKLLKAWGIIALFMLVFFLILEDLTKTFWYTFLSFFAISGIFILFGWDKHVTYDEGPNYEHKKFQSDEDFENWLE